MKDGGEKWSVKSPDFVTPGIENYIHVDETKTARLKREDPYGFGITILAMGIVFFCLALLYVFFRTLGMFMAHKQTLKKAGNVQPIKAAVKTGEKLVETGHKTKVMLKDGMQTGGIDKEVYIAVISMALKQYQDDVHDIESNVITIKPHHTPVAAPAQQAPAKAAGSGTKVPAPLPGTITEVKVKEGDTVKAGDTVVVLEAMKMQNSIEAECSGTVTSVIVKPGDTVMEGDALITIG